MRKKSLMKILNSRDYKDKWADLIPMAIMLIVFVVVVTLGVSFLIVQLFVWLICLCFGIDYVFLYGVGIWLIISVLDFFKIV